MLYVIRGIDAVWAGGNEVGAASLPGRFVEIGYGTIADVPYLALIAVVAVGIAALAVRTYRTPREFYATGSNPVAAELAGVPVRKRVFTAFVISGAIAGVAGALWLSYFATVDSTAGSGYEFLTLAAIVVGGVSVFGGSGSIIGAALGVLLVNTMDSALVVVKVSSSWDEAFQGHCCSPPLSSTGLSPCAGLESYEQGICRMSSDVQTATGGTSQPDMPLDPGGGGLRARLGPLMRWESGLVVLLLATVLMGSSCRRCSSSPGTSSTSVSTSASSPSWHFR